MNTGILVVVAILVAVALRARGLFRRQQLRAGQLRARLLASGVIAVVVVALGASHLDVVLGDVAGAAAGAIVGVVGYRLTRIERTANGIFYQPNVVVGIAVLALFVAQILYRARTFAPAIAPGGSGGVAGVLTGNKAYVVRAQMQGSFTPDIYFLGTDGISARTDCIKDGGANANENVQASIAVDGPTQSSDPDVKRVVATDGEKFPGDANLSGYTFAGYDAAKILLRAVGRAIEAKSAKSFESRPLARSMGADRDPHTRGPGRGIDDRGRARA